MTLLSFKLRVWCDVQSHQLHHMLSYLCVRFWSVTLAGEASQNKLLVSP